MLTLVTSMNAKLYAEYGARFLEGWERYAGDGVRLVVCFEGEEPDHPFKSSKKIFVCNIYSELQRRFRSRYGRLITAAGMIPMRANQQSGLYYMQYNYRYDALRFSFKAYSLHRVFRELQLHSRFVGWIDSDVVCLKKFDLSSLAEVLPSDGTLASYLGRDSFPAPNPYSECSLFIVDHDKAAGSEFIDEYIRFYDSGEVFELVEWHDCMVFDEVRKKYEVAGYSFKDLSGPFKSSEHPFINSELGKFFDHLKGPVRKANGTSSMR